jgi:TonB family protein
MTETFTAERTTFGLLPEPERNPASFLTSSIINATILTLLIMLGTIAHHEIQLRKMESTTIYFPTTPPPPIRVKVKVPPASKLPPPPVPKVVKLEAPKIKVLKIEPKPEIKLPVIKEAMALPNIPAAKPAVALAPQPKPAIASAVPQQLGDPNGVKPNPNATRPATIAAFGNPNGGAGNGAKSGSSGGVMGKVASAGLPGGNGGGYGGGGRVGAAGIPGIATAAMPTATVQEKPKTAPPILLSHAQPEYTAEARQLKIEGDVVLRVTITTGGQMLVHSVIRGLGHGLDESAMRSAPTYKFQPATKDGQPVEYTTNIIIKFQTA